VRENAVKDVFYTACAVIKEHTRMGVYKKVSQVKVLVRKHVQCLGVEPLGVTIDKLNVVRLSLFAFEILGITAGRSRENRVLGGDMEQVKPFHVPQERQNVFVFYINGKDHIPTITVKWGKGKVTFLDGILRPCGL
jgi:hypothetical protein